MSNSKTMESIYLDFETCCIEAELFSTPIARKFAENLPLTIHLQRWGDEVYGPINMNLGEDSPVPVIPPGGIAYSAQGSYLCIFFGQTPAWKVDYIGQIKDDQWKVLVDTSPLPLVKIYSQK